ncbi:MAG TPA: hypothetical protein VF543_06030 [Pyrinomonadaceae bacterium]|jgi:hypothetical protein
MKPIINKRRLIIILIVFYIAAPSFTVNSKIEDRTDRLANIYAQQSFPPVPDDLTRIYYVDIENKLAPLPFENGITSVNVFSVAQDDRTTAVKLNGTKATTVLADSTPSFYVFVADRMDPPPHLLVRLMSKNGSRQFTITTIKGRKGYAPLNEENIRLEYQILERLRVEAGKGRILFVNYMKIYPRQRLEPGEYAIVGDSLSDVATFSIK